MTNQYLLDIDDSPREYNFFINIKGTAQYIDKHLDIIKKHISKVKKSEASNIPSPPKESKTTSFKRYLNDPDFKSAKIYFEGKKISKDDAIKLYKKYGSLEMLTKKLDNGIFTIELTQVNTTLKSQLPPPPPPQISPNASDAEKRRQKKVIEKYNKLKKEADMREKKSKLLPPPPPPISPNTSKAEKERQKKVIKKYNKLKKETDKKSVF